jgi:hypothetical protein
MKTTRQENFMVRVRGEPFRCTASTDHLGREPPISECGCNVFQKDEQGRFVCNSCDARYIGEPATVVTKSILDMKEKDYPF